MVASASNWLGYGGNATPFLLGPGCSPCKEWEPCPSLPSLPLCQASWLGKGEALRPPEEKEVWGWVGRGGHGCRQLHCQWEQGGAVAFLPSFVEVLKIRLKVVQPETLQNSSLGRGSSRRRWGHGSEFTAVGRWSLKPCRLLGSVTEVRKRGSQKTAFPKEPWKAERLGLPGQRSGLVGLDHLSLGPCLAL